MTARTRASSAGPQAMDSCQAPRDAEICEARDTSSVAYALGRTPEAITASSQAYSRSMAICLAAYHTKGFGHWIQQTTLVSSTHQ